MGTQHSKRGAENDDIISQKSLEVVKEVILLLKQHSREEGLFRRSGRQFLRQHILESLKRGEKLQISNTPETAKECAAALQLYLMQLKAPVIPRRVQQLLLADNPGIEAQIVAEDALGLLKQDVSGRHSELLIDLLGLLKHLLIFPPPSERTELQASSLVITFLPVFFNMTSDDMMKWRQVASRLNELIIEAPEKLFKKKANDNNSAELVLNDTNPLIRIGQISLLYPLLRFVENRNNYRNAENLISFTRSFRRPLGGRVHPIITRPSAQVEN